jgi:hypothetical protein
MILEVLHVPDCPNLETLLDRLGEATDLPVATHQVASEVEAAAWAMCGSPTLLVDGIDPFADADQRAKGLWCRIYRDENGQTTSAPSVEQLRRAVEAAARANVLSAWRTRALPFEASRAGGASSDPAYLRDHRPPTRPRRTDPGDRGHRRQR